MKELAVRLAVIRELETRIKEEKAALNAEFFDALDEGDAKAAVLPDNTKLGKVSKVAGRNSPSVVDEVALVKWVKANHPTEIVETVRDSYRSHLLETAKRHGMAVDETTGEVVPGIEMREGRPYIRFTADKNASQVIESRWRELVSILLQLEGGTE